MNAVRFIVSGRVQGVGFRWFVRREAARLDLAGFVRNLPDGTVEVVAQGPHSALGSLEAVLAKGPPAAWVSGVDKSNLSHQMDLTKPFDVR